MATAVPVARCRLNTLPADTRPSVEILFRLPWSFKTTLSRRAGVTTNLALKNSMNPGKKNVPTRRLPRHRSRAPPWHQTVPTPPCKPRLRDGVL
jgi:hypothetical protein